MSLITSTSSRDPRSLVLRDRLIIFAGLAAVTAVGWAYMFYMAWAMQNMHLVDMWMPPAAGGVPWDAYDFWMLFVMWAVMMIAMMTPSVVPMVSMYATVSKSKRAKGEPFAPTFIFLGGYLAAWAVYSVLATAIQYPLHVYGLLDPMMDSRSYLLSGSVLLMAGLYQWTPLKDACLTQCRTPLNFLMTSWREGDFGAFRMGLHHGLYCVGCCWALMAVMLAVGVMNMLWVALLTVLMLLEKVLPWPQVYIRGVTGIFFVLWGAYWLYLYAVDRYAMAV